MYNQVYLWGEMHQVHEDLSAQLKELDDHLKEMDTKLSNIEKILEQIKAQ